MANKQDLVDAVAEKLGVSKKDSTLITDTVFEQMGSLLSRDGSVVVTGTISAKISDRAARDGYNPKTGKKIKIPATKVVTFKAGKNFKEAVLTTEKPKAVAKKKIVKKG
jgi:DNA-binding protein HU-beta